MKEQFLVKDINAVQVHLRFIDQSATEINILVSRGEFAQAETLAKEQLQSLREVKRLQQQRAKNHQQLLGIAKGLKNKGILSEVINRV